MSTAPSTPSPAAPASSAMSASRLASNASRSVDAPARDASVISASDEWTSSVVSAQHPMRRDLGQGVATRRAHDSSSSAEENPASSPASSADTVSGLRNHAIASFEQRALGGIVSGFTTRPGMKSLPRRRAHVRRTLDHVVGADSLDVTELAEPVSIELRFSRVGHCDDDWPRFFSRAHVGCETRACAPYGQRGNGNGELMCKAAFRRR